MNFDLNNATVLLVLTGSRGYGTNNEDSDWDYRGIAIPPLDTYIGTKAGFEQSVDGEGGRHVWKNFPEGLVQPDADMQVMEICKFARLAADCNPSIIEILFSSEDKYVRKHPVIDHLLANKEMFLSRAAKARFCGYALSQLNRIRRHKRWHDCPLTEAPKREDFGLPGHGVISPDQIGAADALIQKEVNAFVIDQEHLGESTKIELTNGLNKMMRAVWVALSDKEFPIGENKDFASMEEALFQAVMMKEGYSENFIEVLGKEKKFRAAQREWDSFQKWKKDRNAARAVLEKKFGFDVKHGMHLVRLLRMAREILETGKVIVARPDAEELKSIREGAWSYEKMIEFAEKEDAELFAVMRKSPLPAKPDGEKIHQIVFETVMKFNQ